MERPVNEAPESPSRIGCRGRLVALGLLAPFTSGCDPVVNFYGSFFPAWVLALGAVIFLTILLRWLFAILKIEQHLGPLVLVYSALTLLLTCATWLALFAP